MQEPLELLEQCWMGPFEWQVQRHHDPWEQSVGRARRVRNQTGCDVIVELSQKIPDECCFPAADFASYYGEASAVYDAKLQHSECQSVVLAPIDQIRIRQNRKRLLSEPIKALIHLKTLESAIRLPSFEEC